jgi:folylpolyglutamate synthase/dihydropteroate synthase
LHKVGVYNSPHLNHYSDAVLVNDRPDLPGWYDSMHTIQEALGGAEKACGKYTAFEVTCAAMWLQLERAKVDYAVVEAGVGGLRDATNVCESVSEQLWERLE